MTPTQKTFRPLPFYAYYLPVLVLSLIGLFVSAYLSVSHYRVHTDTGYQSFCALTRSINCDTVSQSPYSVLWGLPIGVWGIAGYGFYLLLTIFSAFPAGERGRLWTLCFAVALVFSTLSLVFAAVSGFLIGSYCILCIAIYAVNLLLLYFTWIIRRRFQAGNLRLAFFADFFFLWEKRRASLPVFGLFGIGLILTGMVFPAYWQLPIPVVPLHASIGMTADGHPWIGAEHPVLEIVEFADYQCFQCKKMHYYLRELIGRYPNKIRLVHRSYPMDHEVNNIVQDPFHIGSGKLSIISIHAAATGKFWEVNDLIYRIPKTGGAINLREIADATGMDVRQLAGALKDPGLKKRLEIDIRHGMQLGITGTPSYVINGNVYQGFIPPKVISSVIDEK